MILKDFSRNIKIRPMPYRKTLVISMVTMVGSSVLLYKVLNEAHTYLPDVIEAPPVQNQLETPAPATGMEGLKSLIK